MTNLLPKKFSDLLATATDEQREAFRRGTLAHHFSLNTAPLDPDLKMFWEAGKEWARTGLLTNPEERVSHG